MSEMHSCPCGSKNQFSECCEPFLKGEKLPESPEQLMRSRFSAFCRGGYWQYILDTWHPEFKPKETAEELAQDSLQGQWEKLEVRHAAMHGEMGEVTFCAWYRNEKGLHPHLERSFFVRLDGKWVYTEGEFLPYVKAAKTKPNEPCPCGSGKKYKKCCG